MKISTIRRLKARALEVFKPSYASPATPATSPSSHRSRSAAVPLLASLMALLLAACGGSGGTSGNIPAAPSLAATLTFGNPADSDDGDAPHGDLQAPGDDGEPPAPAEDDGPPQAVDPADFALTGYAPGWRIVSAPDPEDGQSPGAVAPPDAPAATTPASASSPSLSLYVSPKGSDKQAGTAREPFKTITRAARAARPGTTVYVAPGVYADGIKTTTSGNEGARIYYVSTTKWGARIEPPAKSVNKAAWDNRGSHVDIVGFEIDGRNYRGGIKWSNGIYNGGSHGAIRNNHVHHIAQNIGCTGAGGSGIGVDSYFYGVKSDVIGNRVHDIGPAGCRFIQGIYMSTSGSIKNNVVYRVAEGAIHLWHDANNVIITNNTVTASNTGIIIGAGNHYHGSAANDYTAVYSNIVYDNKMGISEQGKTGRNNSYRNNLVFQNTSYNWQLRNGITHSDTVSRAPQFAGESRGELPDLKLAPSSPAIGAATSSHAADTDFEGRARNASTGYDIGAYQH